MATQNDGSEGLKAERPERRCLWEPILDGSLGERALEAVQGIITELPDPSSTEISDASLAGGTAGLAVLCAYLALADYDDGENAEQFLEQAVRALSSGPMEPSLYSGLAGVAWATAHLQQQLFEADEENSNATIDEALRPYLARSPWRGDYDLIGGLVGFGVYALERL